ncbi:MAG: hypothetical protein WAW81_03135 [Minisyncoccia bacterium]
MKMSTPGSGGELGKGKVLILVFEEGESKPTLCVKTTRIYSTGGIIKKNHDNLKLLARGVVGTMHASMFAKSLYLHDDGKVVFSIETVCPGARFSAEDRGIELVMEKYISWQSHLADSSRRTQSLSDGMLLPVLVQHGDMTPDNVLASGEHIYLVDYDYVGENLPPGFDIFNFLSKLKRSPEILRSYNDKYFPRYFESIGAKIESYESLLPLYRRVESKRKVEQT